MTTNDDLPSVDDILPELFDLLSDGEVHTYSEALEVLADTFSLTVEQRNRTNPANNNSSFGNRINMARQKLTRSKTGETLSTGRFRLTECGKHVYRTHGSRISVKFLEGY